MQGLERIALAVVGVAMVTTLVLPKRQTVGVINSLTGLFRGSLATAMGTGRRV